MKNLLTAAFGAVLGMVLLSTPWGVEAQATIRNVTISAIAAGDTNIGNVDIVSMPADATELPAAAALGDNTANPTVPGVGAFLMCWDGATWDRCTSGSSADTELPNAAALADNTANPTVPGVAAFLMCFDSSTWDRCLVASDMTIGTAFATSGPGIVGSYKDFDGSALPTTANVGTEEEANPFANTLQGIMYGFLTNENGSKELGKLEDDAHASGDYGVPVWTRRIDSPATSAGSSADYATLDTDENGAVYQTPVATNAGGASNLKYTSVGTSEDKHAVCTGPCNLYSVTATNHTSTGVFLRCENDTSANTTAGSETVELDLEIPGATTGAGLTVSFPVGTFFSAGLTCWIVTGEADTDVAEVGANDVKLFYTFKQ